MNWLFASGHAIDIVLAVLVLEYVVLVAVARWRAGDGALRLLPGALMLVAVRGALTGLNWRWIALPLLLSFPIHVADLVRSANRPDKPR